MHRLRDKEGDKELAIGAYERAVQSPEPPAAAYRELAYLHLKKKSKAAALTYFEKYLSADKDANDKEMILFYTDSLKGM